MTDILNIHSPEWMADAKCAGRPVSNHPADLRAYGIEVDVRWQPDGATQEDRAVRNCAGCPVLTQCLSFAMADPDLTGVWGGTTTAQRVQARKPKPKPVTKVAAVVERDTCGTNAGYTQHRQNHETVCDPCRTAFNDYRRAWRNGKKVVA